MTSSSTAPEAPRSAWIDGVATLAIVASAWAMNGATSNTPSSQPFRSTRCGVIRFLPFGATRPAAFLPQPSGASVIACRTASPMLLPVHIENAPAARSVRSGLRSAPEARGGPGTVEPGCKAVIGQRPAGRDLEMTPQPDHHGDPRLPPLPTRLQHRHRPGRTGPVVSISDTYPAARAAADAALLARAGTFPRAAAGMAGGPFRDVRRGVGATRPVSQAMMTACTCSWTPGLP